MAHAICVCVCVKISDFYFHVYISSLTHRSDVFRVIIRCFHFCFPTIVCQTPHTPTSCWRPRNPSSTSPTRRRVSTARLYPRPAPSTRTWHVHFPPLTPLLSLLLFLSRILSDFICVSYSLTTSCLYALSVGFICGVFVNRFCRFAFL